MTGEFSQPSNEGEMTDEKQDKDVTRARPVTSNRENN